MKSWGQRAAVATVAIVAMLSSATTAAMAASPAEQAGGAARPERAATARATGNVKKASQPIPADWARQHAAQAAAGTRPTNRPPIPAPAASGERTRGRATNRGAGAASAAKATQAKPDKSQLVIVRWKTDANDQARGSARSANGVEKVRTYARAGLEVARVAAGKDAARVAVQLSRDPAVAYAEPNHVWFAESLPSAPTDTLYPEEWGLNNTGQALDNGSPAGTPDVDVNAPEAWATTTGDPNVVVGIIDEGIDFDHPDLSGKAWTNPGEIAGNGVDDDGNGYVDDIHGWDFWNGDDTVFDAVDGDQHGTHVAGVVAANTDDASGVAGTAPNVQVMSLKFLGPQGGYTTDAIAAIDYAADKGVRILNNSWGGDIFDQALKDAIAASGATFLVAAGNDGLDTDATPAYPASYDLPNLVSVAAVDNAGALAGFSNYGATSVDVGAPGVSVVSSLPKAYFAQAPAGLFNSTNNTMWWGVGLEDVDGAANRADLIGRSLEQMGATGSSSFVVVDDDATDALGTDFAPLYSAAITDHFGAGTDVTTISVPADTNGPDLAALSGKVVVWETGDDFGWSDIGSLPLMPADLTTLDSFVSGGGQLLLAGPDAIFGNEDTSFVTDTLDVYWLGEEGNRTSVDGAGALTGTSWDVTGADSGRDSGASDFHDFAEPNLGHALPVLLWPEYAAPDYTDAYAYWDGTSMATPFVTGAAALVLSNQPTLTPEQVATAIKTNVKPLASLTSTTATGGIVDAAAALTWQPGDDDIPGRLYPAESGTPVTDSADESSDLDDVYAIDVAPGDTIDATLAGPAGSDFDLLLYGPTATTVFSAAGMVASSESTTLGRARHLHGDRAGHLLRGRVRVRRHRRLHADRQLG